MIFNKSYDPESRQTARKSQFCRLFLLFTERECIIFGKSMIFRIGSIVFDKFFIMSYLK